MCDLSVVIHVYFIFVISQVQVRCRIFLLVHIGRCHVVTHQEFWVSKLFRFISVNYAIYFC